MSYLRPFTHSVKRQVAAMVRNDVEHDIEMEFARKRMELQAELARVDAKLQGLNAEKQIRLREDGQKEDNRVEIEFDKLVESVRRSYNTFAEFLILMNEFYLLYCLYPSYVIFVYKCFLLYIFVQCILVVYVYR